MSRPRYKAEDNVKVNTAAITVLALPPFIGVLEASTAVPYGLRTGYSLATQTKLTPE
jgi:hypothetical protein